MRFRSMGFALFISLFFLVGFGLLGWGLRSLYLGRQALKWPTVEGQLVECRLEEHSGEDGPTWQVKVRYNYCVADKNFEGDRVAFGYAGSSTSEHQQIYGKLHGAKRVMVKYDPSDPARSVLASGLNRSTFVILIFAATWLLFTSGFTVLVVSSGGTDSRIVNTIQVLQ